MNLHLQEIESLQNSLREREKYVTELENRLRALWDKLEGERKHYMEHLQLNEELVSEIELENERLKEQNKRQNEAIDSLREMYAKDGKL
jgi:DNA repair exonuclease SbcCD ATPase subunit